MEPDIRWTIVEGASSFAEFQQNFTLKKELNGEIDKALKDHHHIIKQLVIHSYYKYEFITVAAVQNLLLLEFVLNYYYKKINGAQKKLMMANLIQWFINNDLLESEDKEVLEGFRVIRNYHMHPTSLNIQPISVLELFDKTVEIINLLDERVKVRFEKII